ncbi:hypothetical protein BJV82DRAFT_598808 [Fennellomyces sp. T-0311]|nr:hypothetical protein BJV82DRAFT_598808 [Fennellomyces sp. T-0311]
MSFILCIERMKRTAQFNLMISFMFESSSINTSILYGICLRVFPFPFAFFLLNPKFFSGDHTVNILSNHFQALCFSLSLLILDIHSIYVYRQLHHRDHHTNIKQHISHIRLPWCTYQHIFVDSIEDVEEATYLTYVICRSCTDSKSMR